MYAVKSGGLGLIMVSYKMNILYTRVNDSMEIYDNELDFRLYKDRLAGGFIMAMLVHGLDNFEENEDRKKEFSEDDYKSLRANEWNAHAIRPDTFDMCFHIIKQFLNTAVTSEQKEEIEALDEDDKLNFGNQLYIALFRNLPDAMGKEYQQAVENFPAIDFTPDVVVGADGKAGIAFTKR